MTDDPWYDYTKGRSGQTGFMPKSWTEAAGMLDRDAEQRAARNASYTTPPVFVPPNPNIHVGSGQVPHSAPRPTNPADRVTYSEGMGVGGWTILIAIGAVIYFGARGVDQKHRVALSDATNTPTSLTSGMATINTVALKLRECPGADDTKCPAITTMYQGDEVTVLSVQKGNWAEIQYQDKDGDTRQGYAKSRLNGKNLLVQKESTITPTTPDETTPAPVEPLPTPAKNSVPASPSEGETGKAENTPSTIQLKEPQADTSTKAFQDLWDKDSTPKSSTKNPLGDLWNSTAPSPVRAGTNNLPQQSATPLRPSTPQLGTVKGYDQQ